jgi:2-polyprenyl-6-methoxyphenol hydroxylase-like FAD-dependent oxidoreductase
MIPTAAKVAYLLSGAWNGGAGSSFRDLGRPFGITLIENLLAEVDQVQIRSAFAEMTQQQFDAAIVDEGGSFLAHRALYGAGHFQVHRADLHNALNAAVLENDPDCVHLAHAFSGLVQSESGVAAHFVNGTVVEGDALIGCDGCRSAVRDTVHGSAPASYTGQVAFRALIPCDNKLEHLSAQGASMYIGPKRIFLHYPLRKNTLMNVVAISRQPRWEQEGWAITAKVGELLELYQDFHPSVLEMIGAIQPETLFKWGLRDRDPLEQWTLGRVSTLGDAAHPTSHFLGQGAVMAIEDGMVLGRCFAQAASPEDALLRYERARKHRAIPCKSNPENARTRCKAPILSISARGEVLMTSACSDTIRRPCQSEQADPVAFPGKYGWR